MDVKVLHQPKILITLDYEDARALGSALIVYFPSKDEDVFYKQLNLSELARKIQKVTTL